MFRRYPHIGRVLPAMGYDEAQVAELSQEVVRARADAVVAGTPIELGRLLAVETPMIRALYNYADVGRPTPTDCLDTFLDGVPPGGGR